MVVCMQGGQNGLLCPPLAGYVSSKNVFRIFIEKNNIFLCFLGKLYVFAPTWKILPTPRKIGKSLWTPIRLECESDREIKNWVVLY